MSDKPWRNPDLLHKAYVEHEMSMREIADHLDCMPKTVQTHLKKNNIERRRCGRQTEYEKLEDKEWLKEQYYQKGRTCKEIADELGTYSGRVSQWLKKHDISPTEHPYVGFNDGYLEIHTGVDGESKHAQVHRLAAVAWFGYDEIAGKEIHHKNGVRWDNRESNLEPLSVSDHRSLHHSDDWMICD